MQWLMPPQLLFLCLLAAIGLHLTLPVATLLPGPVNLLGLVVLVAGLALNLSAHRQFRASATNIKTFQPPDRLVTGGLFGWSRNPMYLGFALLLSGVALALGSLSPWAPVLLFVVLSDRWYIPFEEAACAEQLGQPYRDYQARVRRWVGRR